MNEDSVERNLSDSESDAGPEKRGSPGPLESLLMAALASVFFISWGVYVNWDYGMGSVIQVGVTQGVISFVSTFLSADVLQRLYTAIKRLGWHASIVVLLGFCLINGVIFLAHFFAGTPRILPTMAPGLIVSVFFCSAYTYRLSLAFAKRRN